MKKEDLYWLRSALMAEMAASLTWGGAGKSGKPSARLMAPHRWARWESSWMGEGVRVRETLESFASIALLASLFVWTVGRPHVHRSLHPLSRSKERSSCRVADSEHHFISKTET